MDTLNTWTGKKDRKIPRKKGRIIKSNKIERKRKEKKNRTNVGVGTYRKQVILKGREMSKFYFICLKFWPKQPESPTMAQQMFMGKLN